MTDPATPRLILRAWTEVPADLARHLDTYSRAEVARWLGAAPRPLTGPQESLDRVRMWAARTAADGPPYGTWALEVRQTGVVAGTVLLRPLPRSDAAPPTEV